MAKSRRSVWISLTAIACLATGCASPSFQQGNDRGQPTVGSKPGPIKQLAATVGASSVGQTVSKAFKSRTTEEPNDPVSLSTKAAPVTADTYVKLGRVAADSNDIEGAREAYHKALKMKPHHLGALVGLGRVFESQGQLGRASSLYLEATRYHPNDASAFNDLGWCYAREQRYGDAVAALSRAIELKPDRELYRNNIAAVLVKINRIDEAMAHLTDARGETVAHYNVGCLLHEEHRDQAALAHFRRALQQQPSFEAAQQWVETLTGTPQLGEQDIEIAEAGGESESLTSAEYPAWSDGQPGLPDLLPFGPSDEPERQVSWSASQDDDNELRADSDDAESCKISDAGESDDIESDDIDDEGWSYMADEGEPNVDQRPNVAKDDRRQPNSEARLQPLPPSSRRGRGVSSGAATIDGVPADADGESLAEGSSRTADERENQEPVLEARLQPLPPRLESLPSRLQSLPPAVQAGRSTSRY